MEKKRVFFGWQVEAPWSAELPRGRLLDPEHRHMTFAFLGQTDYQKIESILTSFPNPPFSIGAVGIFNECLLLPEKRPRVVAWHVDLLTQSTEMQNYYDQVIAWLHENEIAVDQRHGWMPHVTLARFPFHLRAWRREFTPLPLIVNKFQLYESLGHSKYSPLWGISLKNPFEEIEHTADMGFIIRGANPIQLYYNGFCALAFTFPPILPYLHRTDSIDGLQQVIEELNKVVLRADQEIGCPYKAVSYHSQHEKKNGAIEWEMIVDV